MLAHSSFFSNDKEAELLLVDVLPGGDFDSTGDGDITRKEVQQAISDWKPDAIVNFAGISGESSSKKDVDKAWDVNAFAPVRLRRAVPWVLFIQASTCSIYDTASHKSTYAEAKRVAETELLAIGKEDLILPRFGTVFGISPAGRTRWDLPIHRMIFEAVDKGEIQIPREEMRRPWTLICDLMDVIVRWLNAYQDGHRFECAGPMPVVSFNARMHEIADVVQQMTTCKIKHKDNDPDTRTYSAPDVLGGHTTARHVAEMLSDVVEKAYEKSLGALAPPSPAQGHLPFPSAGFFSPDDWSGSGAPPG